ncbi:MAG: phosphomannomutase [Pseudomonadota bacterium]
MTKVSCFKAYDVRGRIDSEVTTDLALALGRALAQVMAAKRVIIGRDVRATSPSLANALTQGLQAAGADVLDLGQCGTEEVYFATDHYGADAGVMVTASHNPIDYNGFKMVGPGAAPLSDDTFRTIETVVAQALESGRAPDHATPGTHRYVDCRAAYADCIANFIDPAALKPMHILANAGNGAAGPTFDAVIDALVAKGAPLTVTRKHHGGDPTFPNGIPNPLLPKNQPMTAQAVQAVGADMGIAWDGDFDRCFFFDADGDFVPGEYMVGLLADAILAKNPQANIVHDPRVIWNTQAVVAKAGGTAVASKTGHALIKAKMREAGAVYGGEMSAHHYFQDFMYCDSGMIPWVLLAAHVSATGTGLKDLVAGMRSKHPSSGENNFRVADTKAATAAIFDSYKDSATDIDHMDGISMSFDGWRFNLRASNTEPLLRLNVEGLDADLVAAKTKALSDQIAALG